MRSGYDDDCEPWALIRWRGAVASAMRGARGQAFLKELFAALDALPEHKLIADELEHDGAVCAIGAVGKARGCDMATLDPYDYSSISGAFNIAEALAREIAYENDEGGHYNEAPELRFSRMRAWVERQIRPQHSKEAG